MQLKFHTLDVFTAQRFGGNPLAVVLDADDLTTQQMQTIAREFNLSETIFVMAPKDTQNTASVRIIFPSGELPFAGHPTIGCAILLAENSRDAGSPFQTEIRLEEVAGLVPVNVRHSGDTTWAQLTAPVVPSPVEMALPNVTACAAALGLAEEDIGPPEGIGLHEGGGRFFYVPISSRPALANARVQTPELSDLVNGLGVNCVYLYTKGGEKPDTAYRTRLLIPANGGTEDPATGSAAAMFASQIHKMHQLAEGTHVFKIEQGYEMGRPSDLEIEVDVVAGKLSAVRVAGCAIRVSEGLLRL